MAEKLVQPDKNVTQAKCPNCRDHVQVGSRYAHGDQMQCGNCSAGLKVLRQGSSVRLIIADLSELRNELKELSKRIAGVDAELLKAKASFGIGVNGLGVGLLYVVAQVALEEKAIDRPMILLAVGLSVMVGVALEAANYLFLAKRKAINDFSAEVASLRAEQRVLQQKIKDSSR